MGWDNIVTNFQYGPRFRKHRKLIQDEFNETAIPDFHAVQLREIRVLLNNLLKSPDRFMQHLSRFQLASILIHVR
jgi:cytochrome P450